MSEAADLHRALVAPIAERSGLDYDAEMTAPGSAASQSALQFVACGALLLLQYAENFPSPSKRASRRGAKALKKAYVSAAGEYASVFLAHALATFLREFRATHGQQPSSARNERYRQILAEHYPLRATEIAALEKAQQEYRTLRDGVVPDPVGFGEELGTGYHRLLQDPEFAEHDRDREEELLEIQQTYARKYFQSTAGLHALRLVLGSRFNEVEGDLIRPGALDPDLFVLQAVEAEDWIFVIKEHWERFSQAASFLTGLPPLPDPTAQALRERIEDMLDDPSQIDDAAGAAIGVFADDVEGNDTDWGITTDTLVMGYRLRQAECETQGWKLHGEDTASWLREVDDEDGRTAAIATGATSVANSVPEPFAFGAPVWNAVRGWAVNDARRRAAARLEYEDSSEGDPTVADEVLVDAFDFGYGVRFAEQTLAGGQTDDGLDPLDPVARYEPPPLTVHSRDDAIRLLTQTEDLLVQTRLPIGLIGGLMISAVTSAGLDVDAERGAGYLAAPLFGYACRQSQQLPPMPLSGRVEALTLEVDEDGFIVSEDLTSEEIEAAAEWAFKLAENDGFPELVGCTPQGWVTFSELAHKQLATNMRKAGSVPRRLLPDIPTMSWLIRAGYSLAMLHDAVVQQAQELEHAETASLPEMGFGPDAIQCPDCGTVLLGGERQLAHHQRRKHQGRETSLGEQR